MIAALYVDPRGPYPTMEGVDAWDETRDARKYSGPWPVIAHPPCGPWGRLAHLAHNVNQPANGPHGYDRALGPLAVDQVREFGGVLEHPAHSKLWKHCGLPHPGELPDAWGGVTIALDQVLWGHVARKPTWIYLVRVPSAALEQPPFPERTPTHWISGGRSARKHERRGLVPPGIKVCSAQQRRRTPLELARYLRRLAAAASQAEAA